jgi:hypothetical protein
VGTRIIAILVAIILEKIMSNPYESPKSNIKTNKNNPDQRLGWKIFFLFMLSLELIGYYFTYESMLDGTIQTVDIVGFFVYPLMILALFGYAFKKAFFRQIVWKIFFPISLSVDLWMLFSTLDDPELSNIASIIIVAMIMPILLLQYFVLYLYGFTNRKPWD